jgi:hypothetical protein
MHFLFPFISNSATLSHSEAWPGTASRVKKMQEDATDTAQTDDSANEWKRARNREYNRAYRERKKMKILAGENNHVDPDVVERRRACGRERVKRYREQKKVKQAEVKENVAFVDSSMHVFKPFARYALFHHLI